MKICVLVKEVPDAAVTKRINPSTGRLDRSGEKNLNPYDTHAIEAAMQLKEGGAIEVDEIVAVTMGPDSAVRALHKAVSLGADRSVQLTDDALTGSDVAATGYALSAVLEKESPDLVLLGQQSDDGECYTIGAIVADHLHYEGAFNKTSLGAVAEAAKLAKELGTEAHVLVLGDDIGEDLAGSLGGYGAQKVFNVNGPEGLAQPVVDAMAKVMQDNGHDYALFGGGLLG